ncbi:TetR/AcrR family transcriptional regulator [Curtobacterium sp. ME26]|uniref:TetR/AcrR family transcriptional regulator n=1 Tax=Curtobacterium sp. ME26 TaxID=2744254 RepID=UPI0015F4B281|nr:TetR/AcrR family transcriptional regulator [Curtobacterium sp. ME26]
MTPEATARGAVALGDTSHRGRKKLRVWQQLHDAALRLTLTNGLADVTVQQICHEADVAPRTFFNYFQSKHDAALGLNLARALIGTPEPHPSPDDGVLDELCFVVARALTRIPNHTRTRALLARRPELKNAALLWTASLHTELVTLAERRTTPAAARLSALIVLAALVEFGHRPFPTPPDVSTAKEQLLRLVDELQAASQSLSSCN